MPGLPLDVMKVVNAGENECSEKCFTTAKKAAFVSHFGCEGVRSRVSRVEAFTGEANHRCNREVNAESNTSKRPTKPLLARDLLVRDVVVETVEPRWGTVQTIDQPDHVF